MKLTAGSLAAALALVACGVAQPIETTPASSTGAVGVLRVLCSEHRTVVLTPRVRVRSDGIHVVFVNRGGADEFFMRGDDNPDENHGGRLTERITKDVSSHAPGRMRVACYERGDAPRYYSDDERYAEFEIVDPYDLWIPWKVACADPETVRDRKVEGVRSVDDAERWLRERYDLPSDSTRVRPGYPDTQWKGNPWVLVHKGETIAYFHAFEEDGEWRIVQARVCI